VHLEEVTTMSSALSGAAERLPEVSDEESGVRRKPDPAVIAHLSERLQNSHPKWRKLYDEVRRRDPKGQPKP
jgi:hypothetical protein